MKFWRKCSNRQRLELIYMVREFNMLTTTKIPSKRLTWNLKMMAFTRDLLFQDAMFSFHFYLVRVLSWRCSKVWIIAPLYWGLPLSWTTTPLLKSGMYICTYIDYPDHSPSRKQIYQPWPCQLSRHAVIGIGKTYAARTIVIHAEDIAFTSFQGLGIMVT